MKLVRALLSLVLAVPMAFAVGTCTVGTPILLGPGNGQVLNQGVPVSSTSIANGFAVTTLTVSCTGDPSTGSYPSTPMPQLLTALLQGQYLQTIEVVPGSPSPTNGYSLTVTDANGADVFGGLATTLSATLAQYISVGAASAPVNGVYSVNFTGNSVASAKTTATFFFSTTPPATRQVLAGQSASAGATAIPVADSSALISPSTATTTLLIAAVSGKNTYVSSIEISGAAAQTVQFEVGTQTTNPCDTSTKTVSVPFQLPASATNITEGTGEGSIYKTVATGQQVCVVTTAAAAVNVAAHYTQF